MICRNFLSGKVQWLDGHDKKSRLMKAALLRTHT